MTPDPAVLLHPKMLLDAALRYSALGFRVLPLHSIKDGHCTCGDADCRSPGKHPLLSRGMSESSADETIVRGWWSKWPGANIGLVMGDHGVIAIDVDVRHNGHLTLEGIVAANGELPETATQRTGNGWHHLFRIDPGKVPSIKGKLGPGIDIKANGYIVAEPSIHANGKRYQWDDGLDLLQGFAPATAPIWLERMAVDMPTRPREASASIVLPVQLREAASALAMLDADDYEQWIEAGMALHATGLGDLAYQVWADWSATSDKYDQKLQRRKWASFGKQAHTVTIRTLFARAQDAGWENPLTSHIAPPVVPDEGLLLSLEQLKARSQAVKWQVKHLVPDDSLGLMFGASGTFKSFVAIDHALHVAHGLPWMGRKTRRGPVVYLAAEGGAGIYRRVQAWHQHHNLSLAENLHVCITPLVLSVERHVDLLAKAIEALPVKPCLIYIDTLSQTFDGEENSATDISNYLRLINAQIRAAFETTVIVIHHTGHAAAERPRGSSAITANVDFMLGVYRPDAGVQMARVDVLKQKDGDKLGSQAFVLERLVLGQDEDGEEISSLTACWKDIGGTILASNQRKSDRYQWLILDILKAPMPLVKLREIFYDRLRGEALKAGESIKQDTAKKAFSRSITALEDSGEVSYDEKGMVHRSKTGEIEQ